MMMRYKKIMGDKEAMTPIIKSINTRKRWEKDRAQIGEKKVGVKRGFIQHCDNMLACFEDLESDLYLGVFISDLTRIQEYFIRDLIDRAKGDEPYHFKEYKNLKCFNNEDLEHILNEVLWTSSKIGFAIGYVIGQGLDSTDPKIQEDIRAIKKVIKEKQLLPYLPR
jgi:hypothetical protein